MQHTKRRRRNELITSMTDAMDDEEYKKIKEEKGSKKEQ